MKVLIVMVLGGALYTSCSTNTQSKLNIQDKKYGFSQGKQTPAKDTVIEYFIEGISAEGSRVKAKYINGKIVECTISIFGETGQIRIFYAFQEGKINVVEKQYTYKAGILSSIKTENDMKLLKEISYLVDANGIPVGNVDSERTDIFTELKKAVPLEIK